VIRARIYDSIYWKEQCFALTGEHSLGHRRTFRRYADSSGQFMPAESIIDKAITLDSVGGVYGHQKPTEFLSLTLKLLTLQPEKAILLEYLRAEEFK
jgi:pre-mRNA-splicing factor 38A